MKKRFSLRQEEPSLRDALEGASSHHRAGRLAEAERAYRAVIALKSAHADALAQLGLLLYQQGRSQEAVEHLAAATAADPTSAVNWSNYGIALAALDRSAEALAAYDRALILAPREPSILANRGNALVALGRLDDAQVSFNHALAIAPDHINALYNRGNMRLAQGRRGDAIADYGRVLVMDPGFAAAVNNRGNAHRLSGRHDLALDDYLRAAHLSPGNAEILANLGTGLHAANRHQDALAVLDAAIACAPGNALAHYNAALVLLHLGNFQRGWREYESRWDTPFFAPQRRDLPAPLWRGDDLSGRTILLHAEQGFGDSIQFLRYAPLVAARGGDVVLEVPAELADLARGMAGIRVVQRGQALPRFDLHCPLMSLPQAFGTQVATIPAPSPYLAAPAGRVPVWRDELATAGGPRVGLVWSGRQSHPNDSHRSVPFAALRPLFAAAGRPLVSLQTDIRANERVAVAGEPGLVMLSRPFGDFADVAAVISQLDAVVTVDTAVAHLAGALGKPVFILLPWASDFRWLLGRDDSPWYPSARLFRQSAPGDWAGAMTRVADELGRLFG